MIRSRHVGAGVRLLGADRSSASSLAGFRDRALRRLVEHIHRSVPFHRDALDAAGVRPDEIRSLADLARLPITGKSAIQARPVQDLVARGVDPADLIVRRTTGSTGQPLEIRRSWLEERLLGAHRWRALRSLGARSGDRYVEVEEVPPADPRDHRGAHRLFERMGLFRQARVHALAEPREILGQLREHAPDVLTGYAGVLAHVAGAAGPDELKGWRPRLVVVHSDTLTKPMRARIASAFRAPVYEIYDANEFNVIASECLETGELHTCDETTIVEVLVDGRPAHPGETGEAVLTALHSYAMPFIRYRTGDLITQGADHCSCGHPGGTVRAVQGRMFDYFPLADGRVIHPYEIVHVLERTAPWLVHYQLVQQARDHVTLRMVAGDGATRDAIERTHVEVAEVLGPKVRLEVERVASLDLEGRAKLRVCQSRVAGEYT